MFALVIASAIVIAQPAPVAPVVSVAVPVHIDNGVVMPATRRPLPVVHHVRIVR